MKSTCLWAIVGRFIKRGCEVVIVNKQVYINKIKDNPNESVGGKQMIISIPVRNTVALYEWAKHKVRGSYIMFSLRMFLLIIGNTMYFVFWYYISISNASSFTIFGNLCGFWILWCNNVPLLFNRQLSWGCCNSEWNAGSQWRLSTFWSPWH